MYSIVPGLEIKICILGFEELHLGLEVYDLDLALLVLVSNSRSWQCVDDLGVIHHTLLGNYQLTAKVFNDYTYK